MRSIDALSGAFILGYSIVEETLRWAIRLCLWKLSQGERMELVYPWCVFTRKNELSEVIKEKLLQVTRDIDITLCSFVLPLFSYSLNMVKWIVLSNEEINFGVFTLRQLTIATLFLLPAVFEFFGDLNEIKTCLFLLTRKLSKCFLWQNNIEARIIIKADIINHLSSSMRHDAKMAHMNYLMLMRIDHNIKNNVYIYINTSTT